MREGLNEREKQCLYWAAKDKSLSETAIELHISPETVKWHRKMVLRKLGCQTITGALVIAIDRCINSFDVERIIQ